MYNIACRLSIMAIKNTGLTGVKSNNMHLGFVIRSESSIYHVNDNWQVLLFSRLVNILVDPLSVFARNRQTISIFFPFTYVFFVCVCVCGVLFSFYVAVCGRNISHG